jgi:hypothetical protein
MRRAVTAVERLHEAREELRLYRWLCDVSLAAWIAPASDGQRTVDGPAEPVAPAAPWPLWQPSWHHERCRPVARTAVVLRA